MNKTSDWSFAVSFRNIILTALLGSAVLAMPAQAEDLQAALVSVYESNPRLLAERARLREIDETYVQARAQGRPTLGGSASISQSWVNFPGGAAVFTGGAENGDISISGRPNDVGIQIVQPLYQGGRVKALKEQAKLGILAAREGLRAQENELFLAAASAYVDVRRDLEATRIRRNNVRVLSRQLEAATARFDVGAGTRTDIAQSESRMALSEAGLAQAEAQLAVSKASYARLVGHSATTLTAPPIYRLPPTLPDAIAAARENNPQLIGAYFNEAAGRAAIDVAKAASRPTVSISGGLNRQREQLSQLQSIDAAQITAQITVPIYSGGANTSRRRQAEHAKTRLAFETRDAELAIDQAITQIWAQLTAAKASLEAAKRQVSAADLAFEGVSLEQSVGTRDQLDVLNAEQETLNAQLSVIEAERNVSVATFQLLSTMGVFDAQGIRLPVDGYELNNNLDLIRYQGLTEKMDRYAPGFIKRLDRKLPGETGKPENWDEDGALDILTEPVQPPSSPRYDPLLDADGDGKNDEKYRPSDSPVD
ncbi:MAG: TolC family outer membrane protein [Litorimonas sp.]